MKVAVLSESPADVAAIRILIDGLLGRPAQSIEPPQQSRTCGWSDVLRVVPEVLKHIHYRTDTHAFAVVIDTDNSSIHQPTHEESAGDVKNAVCANCAEWLSKPKGNSDLSRDVHPFRSPLARLFQPLRHGTVVDLSHISMK